MSSPSVLTLQQLVSETADILRGNMDASAFLHLRNEGGPVKYLD